MDDLYTKMLDSDNFSTRQRLVREHEKNIDLTYQKHPDLKKLDETISQLQKDMASLLAKKFKGLPNIETEIEATKVKLNQLLAKKDTYLQKNNISEDYKEPKWTCEKCQDRGKIYLNNKINVCPCQEDFSTNIRQKMSGLSIKLKDASFKNTDFSKYSPKDRQNAAAVYNMTQKYLTNLITNIKTVGTFSEGLFIHGETGSGKTHLLGCMANHLIENNVETIYIVYADLLDRIRETFGDDRTETESSIIRKINSAKVLLIDDLGMEKNSEFAQKYLGQIIDHRYRNMLPTIITSNFTLSELKDRSKNDMYGERVIWRCVETSHIFHLSGNLRNSI